MKLLSIIVLLISFSSQSIAGSHGEFKLSCVSESLRTHLYIQLNDYYYSEQALRPQVIVLSTMGVMDIFNENQQQGFSFKTSHSDDGFVNVYSTDKEKTYLFKIDFRKELSAKIVIEKGINPRTQKAFSGLELECKKNHVL